MKTFFAAAAIAAVLATSLFVSKAEADDEVATAEVDAKVDARLKTVLGGLLEQTRAERAAAFAHR